MIKRVERQRLDPSTIDLQLNHASNQYQSMQRQNRQQV